MDDLAHLQRGPLRLAFRHRRGAGPTLVFLPGYRSDMTGGKATALDDWAAAEGRAMLRFDYAGCGASAGEFEQQTLHTWRDDVLAMLDRVAQGPVVLVGSSMGGWLMLHAALARPQQVAGLVGIAAAPDFTSWGFSEAQKMTLLREGRLVESTPYDDEPYVTTREFWQSGEALRLLHGGPIAIDCPVRLLHGVADQDVPWAWSHELMNWVRSADVQMVLVKGGDHRLSRDADLELLVATVRSLMEHL
ncbi:MAG: alpha/beta hydrolase [Allosphingosinicella sp.]